jgi:two-component system, NtrC family, nitrogen regulation response regulator NtrX
MLPAYKIARNEFDRRFLTEELERCGGNMSQAARVVGMERSAMIRKLKGFGVVRVHEWRQVAAV